MKCSTIIKSKFESASASFKLQASRFSVQTSINASRMKFLVEMKMVKRQPTKQYTKTKNLASLIIFDQLLIMNESSIPNASSTPNYASASSYGQHR